MLKLPLRLQLSLSYQPTTMSVALPLPLPVITLVALLGACCCSSAATATDTLSPGQVLATDDTLVSNNSKFTLGFFTAPDGTTTAANSRWYLGIWFTAIPDRTTVWVANSGDPILTADAENSSPELTVTTGDGDLLAVVNRATKSVTWSAAHNTTTTTRTAVSAVLLNTGNLVLLAVDVTNSSSSSSNTTTTLWQSFEHPTDTLLPSAKLGQLNKATGAITTRLVSRKSSSTPSPGRYCFEVDPGGTPQLVLRLCNSPSPSTTTYWATGAWNGRYFGGIPEMAGDVAGFHLAFVDDSTQEYLQFNVSDEATVTRNFVDVDGQNKHQVWLGDGASNASKGWLTLYAGPKAQCDVYAACGAFTLCSYTAVQAPCTCMRGFSVRSTVSWAQGDRTGGCVRDAPLDCSTGNNNNSSSSSSRNGSSAAAAPSSTSTDGFLSMPGIALPDNGRTVRNATSSGECSTACLNNCSCTAYSYGGTGSSKGCMVWHDALVDAKQPQSNNSVSDDVGILYLRLAVSEFQKTSGGGGNSKKRGVIIGAVTGACAAALILLLVLAIALIIRRRKKTAAGAATGGGGLTAFSYRELRSATKNFSEKLGQGGFGSVFKGQLRDSRATSVAVKRLDGSFQGEKQFRAEVSSIGVIQHVNLVRLLGFCCEREHRLLVYEHVPNRSLDIHLFHTAGGVFLDWGTRYEIAVGVARGLAYLHEGCRDRIIHCDVKPENILLAGGESPSSLRPKIADFGMAKFVGREFSRVLTTMRGTKGYLAPEWIGGAAVTPKVDVYSYGMVLLELVSGRRNAAAVAGGEEDYLTATSTSGGGGGEAGNGEEELVSFFPVKAARELVKGAGVVSVGGLLDDRLCGEADLVEVERACKVACWCIQDDEDHRPTMGEVVQVLEGVLDCDMPPLPRLLETIFGGRPHSSPATEQQTTTTVSGSGTSTSGPFTSGSGSGSQN